MSVQPRRTKDHAQEVLQGFSDALSKLSENIASPEAGDVALTLLFWHILSVRWQMRQHNLINRRHVTQVVIERENYDGILTMQEACSFGAARQRAATDANAIQAGMEAFCQTQTTLRCTQLSHALRPARFGVESALFPQGCATPALAQLCRDIARIPWCPRRGAPELDFGVVFGQALQQSGAMGTLCSPFAAKALAHALQPRDKERVFDPACGAGELLAACGDVARGGWSTLQANLCGYDTRPDALALAQQLFLAKRFSTTQLENRDMLLSGTRCEQADHTTPLADVVVLALPDDGPPAHANNFPAKSPAVALDKRLELVRQALFCMKPQSGRAGIALSKTLFESAFCTALRDMLAARNWLDAIVQLPTEADQSTPQILLLIRQNPHPAGMALITPAMPPDDSAFVLRPEHIGYAYSSFIAGQCHPDCTIIERS